MRIYDNINKQITGLIMIVVILLGIGAVLYFFKNSQKEYAEYLDYRDELLDNSVKNVVSTYELFSNFVFKTIINKGEILSLLCEANEVNTEQKKVLRNRLYSQLETDYDLLSQYHFKQVQFLLANGDSFLRFNNPEKFGDNVIATRETVRIVNQEQRYVTGFEEGKIFSGYRFVYPLKYQNKHIGSVEVSVSPECVLRELYNRDSDRDLGFIQDKKTMSETVFEDEQWRYKTSMVSDDYVSDNEISNFTESNEYSARLYRDGEFIKKLKKAVAGKLDKGQSFSATIEYNNKIYLVQYYSVKNTSGNTTGYFYSINEDNQIKSMFHIKRVIILLIMAIEVILICMIIFSMVKQNEVRKLALVDQLTRVYNRHYFYELAEREIARFKRNSQNLSIGMIDIDFFKKVNDTYGHAAGDEVLKDLARVAKKSIRISDVFARFGGEEFIVMMPVTSLQDAVVVMERLRINVENNKFPKAGKITVSCGVSVMDKQENLDQLIERADRALYMAKQSGRNKVVALERDVNNL